MLAGERMIFMSDYNTIKETFNDEKSNFRQSDQMTLEKDGQILKAVMVFLELRIHMEMFGRSKEDLPIKI